MPPHHVRWLIALHASTLVAAGCGPAGGDGGGPMLYTDLHARIADAGVPLDRGGTVDLPVPPDLAVPPRLADLAPGLAPDLAPPPAPPDLASPSGRRCGWMFTTDAAARASFTQNAAWFTAIHPVWYAMNGDGVTVRPIAGTDDAGILATARQHGVAVIPLVAGVDSVADVRRMLYSPKNRAAHVKELVALATARGYAGLDLDYEHLWDPADRAPLAAFIAEVGAAMRAAGKHISMAAPSLPAPSTVWSYPDLAAALSEVHLMGYDYHYLGSHEGPTSPLGWIDGVLAQVVATGHPERFTLGLPNYGLSASTSCPLGDCAARCAGPVATTHPHMKGCAYGACATMDRTPNCPTGGGETLFFDDAQSLELKVRSARREGLGGVTYWSLGGEAPGWFAMVRKYF